VKLTIVLIISHLSISAKFCEIPKKYQNSAKKANSVAWLEIPQHTENCGPY